VAQNEEQIVVEEELTSYTSESAAPPHLCFMGFNELAKPQL